jgi:hypothetical protein
VSLTFKIAVGVFLGVIAAFLAINAPSWIEQSRREKWHEEAEQAVSGLTPNLLIQRCGKPLDDITDKAVHARYMHYNHRAGGSVVLMFWENSGQWSYMSMQRGESHAVNGVVYADGALVQDAFMQTAMLPCLEGATK